MVNESSEKNFGIIKIYYPLKGFGFISRELGKDLFFHRSDIADEAWALQGAYVQFSIEKSEKGLQARLIKRVG